LLVAGRIDGTTKPPSPAKVKPRSAHVTADPCGVHHIDADPSGVGPVIVRHHCRAVYSPEKRAGVALIAAISASPQGVDGLRVRFDNAVCVE
jgi:hypothetical protein